VQVFLLLFDGTEIRDKIFTSLFISLFSIPGLLIFCNYWRVIKDSKVIITSSAIRFETPLQTIVMNVEDIIKIKVVNAHAIKLPWVNHHCYRLISKEGQVISLNSYLVILKDLGRKADILVGRSIKEEKAHRLLPLMKYLD
jgi:hypothetical protein